jgi:DNA-binding CsgD family transcriptional regulator
MTAMGVIAAFDPVGRDAELQKLDDFIASVREGAAAVVVSGVAGIGKTVLLRLAAERATAKGMRALVTRCAEAEMPIDFGALADLIEDGSRELDDELSGQQRESLAAAFGHGQARQARPDWLVLARATLATLRGLARRGPLIIAVDDMQWLDPGSRRVLTYALRRAADMPIGLIATVRDRHTASDTLGLADVVATGRVGVVELGPLSLGAIQHLVSARFGVHTARPTMARIHRASGGNPMFALEFARMAINDHPGVQAAPMSVPSSLEQLVQARLSTFQGPVVRLLEIVAMLERPTLPQLAKALGDDAIAEGLLDEAVRAEALVAGGDGLIRFTHPLVAAGMYFAIGPGRRRALHRHLAGIVTSAEARGRHAALASSAPHAATADLVEQGAEAAAARGALDLAAELMTEAARLTPAGDAANRQRRRLASAGWLTDAGEFASAAARLEPLLSVDAPAAVRGAALLLRAECEFADRRLLIDLLRQALSAADNPRLRWHALIRLAHHGGWVSGDVQKAEETAQQALDTAVALSDASLVEDSLAALAFYQCAHGRPAAVSTDTGHPQRTMPARMQWWQISPAVSLGCRLLWAGELDHARRVLSLEHEALTNAGAETRAGFALCWLSEVDWRSGHWDRAEAHARAATEILGDINPTAFPRALLAASAGRAEEAYAMADGVLSWCEAFDERVAPPRFRWLLGLLELSRGAPERARRWLTQAQELLDAAGIHDPGYLPVMPDLIESLATAGRADEAEAVTDRLEKAAASSGYSWAAVAALRSRALISLSRGDTLAACAMSDQAAARYDGLQLPLEHGRALLLAGEARRRAGQRAEAAQRISSAAQIFTELGAALWLERAAGEMRRASPRPNRDQNQLTAAETQVAALVAAGRTNKEAAASLYTSVATVEAHLTRIYRKLGIRSRSELAGRMAAGGAGTDPGHKSGFP